MSEQKMKKVRWFFSFLKERIWLEDMAEKGFFLKNITMGIYYTFEKGEPKHMLYEIERFNLSKKPTLQEIQHKEFFMDMAEELGWKEVTHDESMTYYFAKEYVEGEINEICNDEASREYKAEKFKTYYYGKAKEMVFWMFLLIAICLAVRLLGIALQTSLFLWYDWFVLVYGIIGMGSVLFMWKLGDLCKKELAVTRQEWEEQNDPQRHKTVRKLIWTIRGLNRFLKKEAEGGWVLTGVTLTRYFFEKSIEGAQVYTLDSRWLTNKRQAGQKEKGFKDPKDWEGMNNDWQIQSVKDAKEKGWSFVCALESRAVIYRGEAGTTQALNDPKYDNSLRGISLIGEYGLLLLISGLIGGIIGGLSAWYLF